MKKIIILIILTFTYSAMSQSLSIFDVDASNFPTIKAKFFAFAQDGKQITNLNPSDFEVKENGQPRTVTNLFCPAPQPPIALSSVLTIDVSGSMGGQQLVNAKAAGRAWVEGLPLGNFECAITSFNSRNYFNQDFTTDKNKLLNALNSLTAMGGTDFNAGFINQMSGALLAVEKGKHKKVVVFLTDGSADGDELAIIHKAISINATVYCVTLNMPCPPILKSIANQTGGMYFENITSTKEAEDTYRLLLQSAQAGEPCEIEWQSGNTCKAGITNVDIKLLVNQIITTTSYQSPISSISKLEFNPAFVKFTDPEVGVKVEEKVMVTAVNSDFNVTNITSNNAAFTMTPTSFVLKSGQSRELTVSYLPADSGYVYARFEIENDICPIKYFARGGWKGKKPTIRTIKLIHPNGGEVFVAGSDTVITWEGVLPDEPVKLEYRIDENEQWISIADSVTGFSYNWRVPITPSNKCLARVTAKVSEIYPSCEGGEVQICLQTWMCKNLDVEYYRNGDPIPEVTDPSQWANLKTGAWCYIVNDPAYGKIYGKLYNWYAVNDPRGLAPDGWHIPTDAEWTELTNCLGGSSVAGGKLKCIGTKEDGNGLWRSPNTGATNESGFSALPGGYCNKLGFFNDIGLLGLCWSATEHNDPHAWIRYLYYGNTILSRGVTEKVRGLSVRCVKD